MSKWEKVNKNYYTLNIDYFDVEVFFHDTDKTWKWHIEPFSKIEGESDYLISAQTDAENMLRTIYAELERILK